MKKANIVLGKEYAIREHRLAGTSFQRVKLLEHIRHNKWKAKWLDPNPGLIDYVESAQIIVLWRDHKAYLKDEQNASRLTDQNRREGYESGSPIAEAVFQVFDEMGDDIRCYRDEISGSPEAITRIRARAKDPGTSEPSWHPLIAKV